MRKPYKIRKSYSKDELMKLWKGEIFLKFREKAKSCSHLNQNGYRWFTAQVVKKCKSWTVFVELLGEKPLRKSISKEELTRVLEEELLPKFGENAKNCFWLRENGYGLFVGQAIRQFEGKWTNFIRGNGKKTLRRNNATKEELLKIWGEEIRSKDAKNAKNATWLNKNGYGWFVAQVRMNHGRWINFIKATEGSFEIPAEKMDIY